METELTEASQVSWVRAALPFMAKLPDVSWNPSVVKLIVRVRESEPCWLGLYCKGRLQELPPGKLVLAAQELLQLELAPREKPVPEPKEMAVNTAASWPAFVTLTQV